MDDPIDDDASGSFSSWEGVASPTPRNDLSPAAVRPDTAAVAAIAQSHADQDQGLPPPPATDECVADAFPPPADAAATPEQPSRKRKTADGREDQVLEQYEQAGATNRLERTKKVKLLGTLHNGTTLPTWKKGALPLDLSHLPAEIWHYIFTFCPPKTLGILMSVNKLFRSYLDSSLHASSGSQEIHVTKGHAAVLKPELIWRASRRSFWPCMPAPLKSKTELDMWRLVCSSSCQNCGKIDASSSNGPVDVLPNNEASPGPGMDRVVVVWTFATRTCGPCLLRNSVKEIDLLLSPSTPSALLPAIPFVLLTDKLDAFSPAMVDRGQLPKGSHLVKVFWKQGVEAIKSEFLGVKDMGMATIEEWLKGLEVRGAEHQQDVSRWEKYASSGGIARLRSSCWLDEETSLPRPSSYSAPDADPADISEASTPSGVPSAATTGLPPLPPKNIFATKHERTREQVAELKAARRAEIERRAALLDPPMKPSLLVHIPSFQAATQIITPLDDNAWELLKPRLLAQRADAEHRESEAALQAILQQELAERRRAAAEADKDDSVPDSAWDEIQGPLRARISRYADEIIEMDWDDGDKVTKDSCAEFAASVLLHVRKQFYADVSKDAAAARAMGREPITDPPKGPFTQKLTLENMKWIFDVKIKPHTEPLRKELFLCHGCEGNFKYYGFEGVVQHYAAKHTSALSLGSIVVHWRAEWPEVAPFHPHPRNAKQLYNQSQTGKLQQKKNGQANQRHSAYQVVPPPFPPQQPAPPYHPLPAAAGPPYAGLLPYQQEPYSSVQGPSPYAPSGFVPPQPLAYTSHPYPAPPPAHPYQQPYPGPPPTPAPAYPPPAYAQPPPHPAAAAPPPHPNHSTAALGPPAGAVPPALQPTLVGGYQYNHAAYQSNGAYGTAYNQPLPDRYRAQLEEMAKLSREMWNSTANVKDLPGSARLQAIIYHMAKRFYARFNEPAPLSMFIDGLSGNRDMRPVRNVNGLLCKLCHTAYVHPPPTEQDLKSFSMPQLVNHFQSRHVEPAVAMGQYAPVPEWTSDMILLPDLSGIRGLRRSASSDKQKEKLLSEALPRIFEDVPASSKPNHQQNAKESRWQRNHQSTSQEQAPIVIDDDEDYTPATRPAPHQKGHNELSDGQRHQEIRSYSSSGEGKNKNLAQSAVRERPAPIGFEREQGIVGRTGYQGRESAPTRPSLPKKPPPAQRESPGSVYRQKQRGGMPAALEHQPPNAFEREGSDPLGALELYLDQERNRSTVYADDHQRGRAAQEQEAYLEAQPHYQRYSASGRVEERRRSRSPGPRYVRYVEEAPPEHYRERSPPPPRGEPWYHRPSKPFPQGFPSSYNRARPTAALEQYEHDVGGRPSRPSTEYGAYELIKARDEQGEYYIKRPIMRQDAEPEKRYAGASARTAAHGAVRAEAAYPTYEHAHHRQHPIYASAQPIVYDGRELASSARVERGPYPRADASFYEEYDPRYPATAPPHNTVTRQPRYM